MSQLIRFGVSLEKDLLEKFDAYIKAHKYTNRSEALRDLIRCELIKEEWQAGTDVAGIITVVFDHHKRSLVNKLTELQHDHHRSIISTQHIHLDHHNCLEVILLRGKVKQITELGEKIVSLKGVKLGRVNLVAVE